MSIIEKAVEKITNEGIQPNKVVQQDGDKVSTVFGSVKHEKNQYGIDDSEFPDPEDFLGNSSKEDEVELDDSKRVEIDRVKLKKAQVALEDEENPRLTEELRMIKRRLLINAAGLGEEHIENGNLIMITSSLPSEGKTFIATNLALSIAREIDRTVLLVDADIAKSDVTNIFGMRDTAGLTEYLNGEVGYNEIMHPTDIDGLALLPSGQRVTNSTELLSSNKMIDLVKKMSNYSKDRIVVIDSPPLLATSEAQVLASLAGQVAFVVKADETREQEFINAIERLDHSKYVGLVLNQSSEEAESGYYGDYYKS